MVKKPFIGQMDRRITIVKLVKSPDLTGGIKTTDETICEVFSSVTDLSGSDTVEGKVMNIARRSYRIRYQPVVAAWGKDFVIIDGASRLRIVAPPVELGRRSYLELTAEYYE